MASVMERERQGQCVLEKGGNHGQSTAMREPVGMKCNENAGDDRKQAEADPSAHEGYQRLIQKRRVGNYGLREMINHLSEQDRLGKLAQRKNKVCHHKGDRNVFF